MLSLHRQLNSLLLAAYLLLCSCTVNPAVSVPSSSYSPQKLPVQKIDLAVHHIKNAAYGEDFNVDCHFFTKSLCIAIGIDAEHNDHRTKDAGLRLFLVEKSSGNVKIRYRSRGSNSSYNLSPTFFKNSTDDSWIVLAENGAEYTYGTRAFIIEKEGLGGSSHILDIGDLDVGVEWKRNDEYLNLSSVVPHTKIIKDGKAVVFSFTQDVVVGPGGQTERKIAKDRIRYIYTQGQLQAVTNPSPATSLPANPIKPDRLIQSKKVQGRFIKSLWGDYLYSFVRTKSGEIMFMINSNEDCFLRQHHRSELSIDYDIVDRYIPQASGYSQVNIIRHVQSKTVNLANWQKSVTTQELNQCEKQNQADTAKEK